jgi:hypothetical protein
MNPGKNQRKEPRVPAANSFLIVAGQALPLRDWSYSGFFAGPYDGKLALGEEFPLSLRLSCEQGKAEIRGRGKLIRNEAAGIAGTWVLEKPGPQEQLLLHYFLAYPDPSTLNE